MHARAFEEERTWRLVGRQRGRAEGRGRQRLIGRRRRRRRRGRGRGGCRLGYRQQRDAGPQHEVGVEAEDPEDASGIGARPRLEQVRRPVGLRRLADEPVRVEGRVRRPAQRVRRVGGTSGQNPAAGRAATWRRQVRVALGRRTRQHLQRLNGVSHLR